MAEINGDVRPAYMEWLEAEVEKYCTIDGYFEICWDYDDSIGPDDIREAYKYFGKGGYSSPLDYLEAKLLDDLELDFYENYLLRDLKEADPAVQEGWDDAETIFGDLEEAGYNGLDPNLDQLLSQSRYAVNVYFGTEEEQNHDMASIIDAFGNDWRSPDLGRLDASDLDNALSYLVNQQGHSVSEVYDGLYKDGHENRFINSVVTEINENPSEAMSEVAVRIGMDGHEMLKFLDACERSCDSLVIPSDADIGLFNQWSGCGGMLGISLEKDAVMPLSMVREFSIEGEGDTDKWGAYTIGEVYGIGESSWCCDFELHSGVESHVAEDYEAVLANAKQKLRGEKKQPDSIEAAAKSFTAAKVGVSEPAERQIKR